MSDKRIIKLNKNPAVFADNAEEIDLTKLESTQPVEYNHSYYENEVLGLRIGVCSRIGITETAASYTSDEFMVIIEGATQIKNNQTGEVDNITAGQSVVIPWGDDYQFSEDGYLRKFYVIYKAQEKVKNSVINNIVYVDENSDTPWKETSDGHRKKVLYQSNDQCFTSGVWQSKTLTTGLINFPYHEFIYINRGNLICTDEMGVTHHFKKGDALFIPQGTQCAWQVKNKVSIHFTQIKQISNLHV
jgi:uncharacterized cupin superfamily protein